MDITKRNQNKTNIGKIMISQNLKTLDRPIFAHFSPEFVFIKEKWKKDNCVVFSNGFDRYSKRIVS